MSANVKDGRVQKRKRARPLPPDVTARNLAYEKQRREALNENFLDLARLVPSLADARRLSKVLIVNDSIQHFRKQRDMCLAAGQDMQDLLAENRRLVSELNALRSQVGGQTMPPVEPKPTTDAMIQLMSVKDEVYGTFPAGFGDNRPGNPDERLRRRSGPDQGVQLSMDGFLPAPEPAYAVDLSAQGDSNPLCSDIPVLIAAVEDLEAPWNFLSCLDGQEIEQAAPFPFLDHFPPTAALPDNHMPTDMPDTIDTAPSSWSQGIDMGDAAAYLLN